MPVVGTGPLDTALLQLRPAEEVAAADDDGDLRARRDDLGDLPRDGVDHRRVDTDGPAAEHLAAELEQHAVETGAGVFLIRRGAAAPHGVRGERVVVGSVIAGVDPDGVHAIRPGRPRTGRSP